MTDPDQGYFADGMVEEIITALSRIRRLFVIARNSSFTYKGRVVDAKGSVRKAGNRIFADVGEHISGDTECSNVVLTQLRSPPSLLFCGIRPREIKIKSNSCVIQTGALLRSPL